MINNTCEDSRIFHTAKPKMRFGRLSTLTAGACPVTNKIRMQFKKQLRCLLHTRDIDHAIISFTCDVTSF
jgi:hypothetical protein